MFDIRYVRDFWCFCIRYYSTGWPEIQNFLNREIFWTKQKMHPFIYKLKVIGEGEGEGD